MDRKIELDDVDPGLRDALAAMPTINAKSRLLRAISPIMMKLMRTPPIEGVKVSVPKRGNPGLRLFVPDNRKSDAALLWIHGGGYILGAAKIDDPICGQVAQELGIVVASVEYRLAPKHPFPAPLDDCHAIWRWMHAHAQELAIDPQRIAIGGLSAGGGLAAALVQRVHDEGGPGAAAQLLLAPMLDDRTAARRELDAAEHLVWDNSLNHFGWGAYLGGEPGGAQLPQYAAPARRENLEGLPPAWIGYGSIELFREEDAAYAERLRNSGCDVTEVIVEGAPHGFEAWGQKTEIGSAHLRKGCAWLGETLG